MRGSGDRAECKETPSHDFPLLLILFVYSDLIYHQSRASWQDFGFLP
jgi:hypothetical protein